MTAHQKNRAAFDKLAQREEMATIFDAGVKRLAEGDTALGAIPNLSARVEALEARSTDVNVRTVLEQPKAPKGKQLRIDYAALPALAGIAELKRHRDQTEVSKTIRAMLPDDNQQLQRRAAAEAHKSATTVASTTDALTGANLTTTAMGAWVEALQPVSVFGPMAAGGVAVPLGQNVSMTFPNRPDASRGNLAANWVPEGQQIPVKEDVVGSTTFNRFKAAVITVATQEMIEASAEDLLPLLTDSILTDTSAMLDARLMDPTAAVIAGTAPASPWFGAETDVSQGDAMADLAWLLARLTAGVGTRRPAILMSQSRYVRMWMTWDDGVGWVWRDDLSRGNIAGAELIVSASVPEDLLFGIDLANFGFWIVPPIIDASQTTTIHMTPDEDATAPSRSMLQTYSTALRLVQPVSWAMLRVDASTCYLTGVTW